MTGRNGGGLQRGLAGAVSSLLPKKRRDEQDVSFAKRKELFTLNRYFSDPRVFTRAYIVFCACAILLLNWCAHIVTGLSAQEGIGRPLYFAFVPRLAFLPLYMAAVAAAIAGYAKLAYDLRTAFEDLNVGQKGTARWTTRDEIADQYKLVPGKGRRGTPEQPGVGYFPGGGGLPVGRSGDSLYIDDSPVNNLIIGMTRSGKGEMLVFPMIDIYSRAERQASMIISDPKLELYPASVQTLMGRGYEVHVLNLVDPEYSVGYNPLTEIIRYYRDGDIPTAQLLTGAFCYSIFNSEGAAGESGEGKYFADTSTAILSALILAMVEDCLRADEELEQRRLALIDGWRQQMGMRAPEESLPPHIPQVRSRENEDRINLFSIAKAFINLATTKVSGERSELDEYFSRREEDNVAKLLYFSASIAGDRQKGNVFSNMITGVKVFMLENIAKMTMTSTMDLREIGFGTKPLAVFIGLPDYDSSNAFISTAYIRQAYFTLAKMATHAPGGKCFREVVFLLDEFGNIPPIEGMSSMVTVCLGRNIRFNLVLQSYAQLYELYGDNAAKTIAGNCGNHVYIMTEDFSTAEDFSDLLGKRTMTVVNRTGRKLSTRKEFTEMFEEQPLLTADQLMVLKPGETVLVRRMKRTDLAGRAVRPYPLKNLEEDRLRFRYEYLADFFPTGRIAYDSPQIREVWAHVRAMQLDMVRNGTLPEQELLPETPQVLDIEVETTKGIDYAARQWSVKSYLELRDFNDKVVADALDEHDLEELLLGEFGWSPDHPDYWSIMSGTDDYHVRDILCTGRKYAAMEGQKERGYRIIDIVMRNFDKKHVPPERPQRHMIDRVGDGWDGFAQAARPAADARRKNAMDQAEDAAYTGTDTADGMLLEEIRRMRDEGLALLAEGRNAGCSGCIGSGDAPYTGTLKRKVVL
jgi:type IV secretion system protein VirD4